MLTKKENTPRLSKVKSIVYLILTEPSLCLGAGTVCIRFRDSVHDVAGVDCSGGGGSAPESGAMSSPSVDPGLASV